MNRRGYTVTEILIGLACSVFGVVWLIVAAAMVKYSWIYLFQ